MELQLRIAEAVTVFAFWLWLSAEMLLVGDVAFVSTSPPFHFHCLRDTRTRPLYGHQFVGDRCPKTQVWAGASCPA